MFGFGENTGKRLRRALDQVMNSPDPPSTIVAAEAAFGELDKLAGPWPFSSPSRGVYEGLLHRQLGYARSQLNVVDPPHHAESAVQHFDNAIRLLEPEGHPSLSVLYLNTATAYAERVEGSKAENIEEAIRLADKARAQEKEPEAHFHILVSLAQFFGERHHGIQEENFVHAVSLCEEALRIQSRNLSPIDRAGGMMTLGTLICHRDGQGRIERFGRGIECLEAAAHELERLGEFMNAAMAFANLANALAEDPRVQSQLGRTEQALVANEKAISLFSRCGASGHLRHTMVARAQLLALRSSDVSPEMKSEAVAILEDIVTSTGTDDHDELRAAALEALSQITGTGGKSAQQNAVAYARENVQRVNRDTDARAWALAMLVLGDAQYASSDPDDFEEAIESYIAALEIITPEADVAAWATGATKLANMYAMRIRGRRSANLERAISLLSEVIGKISARDYPDRWVDGARSLGQAYLERLQGSQADNIEIAITLSEEALAIVGFENLEQRSQLMNLLGYSFQSRRRGNKLNNLQSASWAYREALNCAPDFCSPAAILRLRERRSEVLVQLRAEAERLGKLENREVQSHTNRLGTGSLEAYVDNLKEAASSIDAAEAPEAYAHAQKALGEAYLRFFADGPEGSISELTGGWKANLAKGITHFEQAISALDNEKFSGIVALLHRKIAKAHTLVFMLSEPDDLGWENLAGRTSLSTPAYSKKTWSQLDQVDGRLTKALALEGDDGDPLARLAMLCDLGHCHALRRDWNAASACFEKAAFVLDGMIGDIEPSEDDLRTTLRAIGDFVEYAPFCALMDGDWPRAVALNESGRARLLTKALTANALPIPPDKRREIISLQTQLTDAEKVLSSSSLIARRRPLETVISLRARLRELVSSCRAELAPADILSHLEEIIRKDTAVIIPMIAEFGGFLLLLYRQDGQTQMRQIEIADHASVGRVMRPHSEQRRAWSSSGRGYRGGSHADEEWQEAFDKMADAIGVSILTPLAVELEATGLPRDSRLIFLCQGILGTLPLAVTRPDRLAAPLIDGFDVSFSPSLRVSHLAGLAASSEQASFDDVAILSGSGRQDDAEDLKFVPTEAKIVEGSFAFGSVSRLDPKLSEAAILEALNGHSIWHICAHAEFDPMDALDSKIRLGESSALDLRTLFEAKALSPPRLVILSACETGLYSQDDLPNEFIGMPTAFLQLGAGGVIASQWRVHDLATTFLMGKFYDFLTDEGCHPRTALRQAQLWLRGASKAKLRAQCTAWEGRTGPGAAEMDLVQDAIIAMSGPDEMKPFAHPSHWGAFVYHGE